MKSQEEFNFQRIKDAIEFLTKNHLRQPSLEAAATHVHMSPEHFQKMFTEWAGTSPKKFLQYVSIEHAKRIIHSSPQISLFETAEKTGLSSTSRLHDLFVRIEGMTPAEYKNEGKNLTISYSFNSSPFGKVIVANTSKGICHIAFEEDEAKAVSDLKSRFPQAAFNLQHHDLQEKALSVFRKSSEDISEIKLHLKGTEFQLKVWESLLKIPLGQLSTYGAIAESIGHPKAARAVGTAIGSNPIAFLIPCHRVIQSSGIFGGYMWGPSRKTAIIGWECVCSGEG